MTPRRMVARTPRVALLAGALLAALMAALLFDAAGALGAPTLSIESPSQGHVGNETRPLFRGTTSDPLDEVTLSIYEGSPTPVQSIQALPEAITGEWSVPSPSPLGDGTYEAVAEQTESATSESAQSTAVEFTVDTEPPSVALNVVASPTNDTTPSFSGSSSEAGSVTVYVFKGSGVSGKPVAEAHASSGGGSWSSGGASPSLAEGTYTALAEEQSSLGNGPGFSQERTFTVVTAKPSVTLNAPPSPSNNATPSFSGTASDSKPVTIYVFRGSSAGGTLVRQLEATPSGGSWHSGAVSHLEDGTYTALAEQESSFGNGAGFSQERTFTVVTALPSVTLNAVPTPSNDATPTFSGTASETAKVKVYVFRGSSAGGSLATTVEASPSGGSWESGATSHLEDGTYTAIAEQESSFGNGPGFSQERTFTVVTAKPSVTLNAVPTPSGNKTPSFSGTASEGGKVKVYVFRGEGTGGTLAAKLEATPSGGSWHSGSTSALEGGTYTAIAEQESSFGNGPGFSQERTFTINTAPPTVLLNPVAAVSNDTTPSFSGYASDTTGVTVYIFRGSKASGEPVAEAHASGNGGDWASGQASPALGEGEYTALAEQQSSLGNGSGFSETVSFKVVTAPPKVTLNSIKSPSNNTTPAFSGTASDVNTVTVEIYAGTRAEGTPVSKAQASGNGGGWGSGQATSALGSGTYTAIAVQESSLGNGPGASNTITFRVDTSSPVVTLNAVPTPSNDASPAFSGAASDTEAVTVYVFKGASATGEVASEAHASGTGGGWSSGAASPSLADGTYTAVAEQKSSLGNPAGFSETRTFVVHTAKPVVTLNQPAPRSSNTTPSFSGTASETTTVTVFVYAGSSASGTPVAGATAGGTGGAWSTAALGTSLPNGKYTAVAVQTSAYGNPEGRSESKTFEVNTKAPSVTLNPPPERSNVSRPTFSGTASESEPVTVYVYAGTSASGTKVAEAEAPGTGGAWSSGVVSKTLSPGTYTAIAAQKSSFEGAPEGVSEARTFTIDTSSPTVTIAQPATPSKDTTPTFSGTASEASTVEVHVLEGATEVRDYTTTASGGTWTTGPVSPALDAGTHVYKAYATEVSSIGNPAGRSAEERTFEVNTTSPAVTIEPVKSPSNNREPTFSGTASDEGIAGGKPKPVVVHVFEAGNPTAIASEEVTPSSKKWTSTLKTELAAGDHSYTAYATQASSLENPEGRSTEIAFVVNTNPPAMTINPIPTPSNVTEPTFTGTAGETEPVTVEIVHGNKPTGSKVTSVTATVSAGVWSAAVTHPLERGEYDAVARQPSSIGNAAGVAQFVFVVAPHAPTLHMTPIPAEINTPTPTFSGTSTETGKPVTVKICPVPGACVATLPQEWNAVAPGGGAWGTAPVSPPLPDGEYVAVATQESAAGELGATAGVPFIVDTHPPVLTLSSPAAGAVVLGGDVVVSGSAGTAPHDRPAVTVQLFAGGSTGAGASPLQSVSVGTSGGAWSATLTGVSPGTYTVRALQSDEAGNVGSAAATFTDRAAPTAATKGLTAGFTWYPARPHTGDTITLVSSSTDGSSPITAYAWDLAGSAFATGTQTEKTTFATPGSHLVQLRVGDAAGRSGTATEHIPVTYPLLAPFPVVRIVTTRSVGRVRIVALSVRAPSGATVQVRCSGKGCPLRSATRIVPRSRSASVTLTFPAFQRSLPPGVVLQIRITKAGRLGKFTSFAIRRGKLPVRSDACLSSTTTPAPVECLG